MNERYGNSYFDKTLRQYPFKKDEKLVERFGIRNTKKEKYKKLI